MVISADVIDICKVQVKVAVEVKVINEVGDIRYKYDENDMDNNFK